MNKFVKKGEKISHEKVYHFDVLILGAGPAGMTAGIYASRYHLRCLIISKDIGGTAIYAEKLENYPGFHGSGLELMKKFNEQTKKLGTEFLLEEITSINKDENGFVIHTEEKEIHTKALILAMGMKRKELEIKGEKRFTGKGVSYCATCDARFFKNKDVIVIGGGDAACHAALLLAEFAKTVYISFRKPEMKAETISLKKIQANSKIVLLPGTIPIEIKGKDVVNEIILSRSVKQEKLKIDGIFIEIGSLPAIQIIKQLGLKMDGDFIVVDTEMKTNVKGVFAAGDVVNRKFKQIIAAASDGAIAAKSAYDYIKN